MPRPDDALHETKTYNAEGEPERERTSKRKNKALAAQLGNERTQARYQGPGESYQHFIFRMPFRHIAEPGVLVINTDIDRDDDDDRRN